MRKNKMTSDPKNILAHITTRGGISLRICFETTLSTAQKRVARNTKKDPVSKLTEEILRSSKFTANNNAPAKIYSFRNSAAKIKIQMNIVLWTNDAPAALVRDSPLKNNKNGIPPPIIPISASNPHCFFLIDLSSEKFLAEKIIAHKSNATIAFLRNVKI